MTIELKRMIIPGPDGVYENPLPRFRDAEKNRVVKSNGSLLPHEDNETLGRDCGTRVLPYRMQDVYTRARDNIERDVIVMENEYIEAVFLPWLGGKLYSLTDKKAGRPILFTNPVFQPANLAIRDAWTSGGVEWNVSQLGHTFSTCSPMFFAKVEKEGEAPFLRMYDYERQKNLFWSIDFHLPDGAKALVAHVRIVNDDDFVKPMYWWTNTAVIETEEARVFSETDEVFYQDWIKDDSDPNRVKYIANGFGHAKMPYYTDANGVEHADFDASYSMRIPRSSEYFFQTSEKTVCPWEAISYKDGYMFFEKSTQPLRYRKMFCWGKGRGGRFWCDFLSEPGQGDYIELQAGLAPSQVHGYEIGANSVISFTQAFSCAQAEKPEALFEEWHDSRDLAREITMGVLSDDELLAIDQKAKDLFDGKMEIIYKGTGWGALEKKRREKMGAKPVPAGYEFPDCSMDDQQKPWLSLLNKGKLACFKGDSFMVAEEWREMLENDTSCAAKLMLGVMEFENGELDKAEKCFKGVKNAKLRPLAIRNRSQLALRKGDENEAIELMKKACEAGGEEMDAAYKRELLQLLNKAKRFQESWDTFEAAGEITKKDDRSRLFAGMAAYEIGNYDFLEELFNEQHATIREGETSLTDLWFGMEANKEAKKRGVTVTPELLEEIRLTRTPPREIDFRMS